MRANAAYCSDRCRQQGKRHPESRRPAEDDAPARVIPKLVSAVESALKGADRLASPIGVRAVMLAQKMSGPVSDSAYAGLDKQLGAVLSEALEGAAAADPLELIRDELTERRARRSA